jgi:hypothetical protein
MKHEAGDKGRNGWSKRKLGVAMAIVCYGKIMPALDSR